MDIVASNISICKDIVVDKITGCISLFNMLITMPITPIEPWAFIALTNVRNAPTFETQLRLEEDGKCVWLSDTSPLTIEGGITQQETFHLVHRIPHVVRPAMLILEINDLDIAKHFILIQKEAPDGLG